MHASPRDGDAQPFPTFLNPSQRLSTLLNLSQPCSAYTQRFSALRNPSQPFSAFAAHSQPFSAFTQPVSCLISLSALLSHSQSFSASRGLHSALHRLTQQFFFSAFTQPSSTTLSLSEPSAPLSPSYRPPAFTQLFCISHLLLILSQPFAAFLSSCPPFSAFTQPTSSTQTPPVPSLKLALNNPSYVQF